MEVKKVTYGRVSMWGMGGFGFSFSTQRTWPNWTQWPLHQCHIQTQCWPRRKESFFPKRCLNKVYIIILPVFFGVPYFFQNHVPFRTSGDCIASAKNLSPWSLNLASSPYSATGSAPWPGWSAIHCATSLQWCQYFLAEGMRCISLCLVVMFPQKGLQ